MNYSAEFKESIIRDIRITVFSSSGTTDPCNPGALHAIYVSFFTAGKKMVSAGDLYLDDGGKRQDFGCFLWSDWS